MAQDTKVQIKEVITPILDSMGIELVDLEISGHIRRSHLRLYIDKTGGVTVDDCEQVSRYVGHALDVADPIEGSYTLEVSSPGLSRPLKKIEDYRRHVGRRVRLKLVSPRNGDWILVGRLQATEDDRVTIQPETGEPVELGIEDIAQGRLEIEW